MSATNGFLRLTPNALAELRDDAAAFELRCRDYAQPDYLEMDKAGYELLFILDPASIEYDNPDADTPYPAVSAVLSRGETIHEQLDLGYGPARIVSAQTVSDALREIEGMTLEYMTSTALKSQLLPDVLMCELDSDMIKNYHWPYLQSLREFLSVAIQNGMIVLRY
jgi:hypothetical protein